MSRSGFTLLEVIIAIAIIGIMLGAVAPMAHRQLVAAREDATRRELDRLRDRALGDLAAVHRDQQIPEHAPLLDAWGAL